jgi:hypothetical protein
MFQPSHVKKTENPKTIKPRRSPSFRGRDRRHEVRRDALRGRRARVARELCRLWRAQKSNQGGRGSYFGGSCRRADSLESDFSAYHVLFCLFSPPRILARRAQKATSADSIRDIQHAPAVAPPLPTPAESGADRFASLLLAEVHKVEQFYLHMQADLEARLAQLQLVASAAKVAAVEALSRDVLRWGNFRALNSTAAIKIIKKFEKKTGLSIKARLMPSLLILEFFVPKDESIFARCNVRDPRDFIFIESVPLFHGF